MLEKILKFFMGNREQKELNKVQPIVDEINEICKSLLEKSDEDIQNRVNEIRQEIRDYLQPYYQEITDLTATFHSEHSEKEKDSIGNQIDDAKQMLKKKTQQILDEKLPEVYAIVKDTCRRLIGHKYDVRGNIVEWNMIPFDVQLIGGIALHEGNIAEMATGEGKTLVATLPLFLNSLVGKGVHLITVNDYLAQRDSEWMSPIFKFHNITMGCIISDMDFGQRQQQYSQDITYGTNNEFGFDYLRDNMAVSASQLVQRDLHYAIIDEVDSVLVDEARTPLIISGPVAESKNFYNELKPQIVKLNSMQSLLVNRLLSEARVMINQDNADSNELGKTLLLIRRAAPRNKAFQKMMKESDLKKLVSDMEGFYLRDKKMHELDNELFYVIDEHHHSAELCEKGREELSRNYKDLFILDQLDDLHKEVEDDETLTDEEKFAKKEAITSIFLDKNEKLHDISQLLKSYALFEKEVDYVVIDNKVIIVDEFTGRLQPGRRYSDGLHQALEAKEGVTIEGATQTLATITLQNYFRMYHKIAGMTGTAVTEEGEFLEIYKLPVKSIPTNVNVSRIDHDDVIYLTKNEKYNAIINEIEYWYKQKKPVLVGTVSVDVSEILSRLLRRKNIPHNVLNAKYHQKEAEIIASAGYPGAVTIATNMAGRGTDIKLGESVVTQDIKNYLNLSKKITEEHPYGLPLDGLHVIGTERHESRRIDRQLRGRAGRQGDPGTSRFFLSLEDDLMRLFGSDKIAPMMMKFGLKEGEAITHPWMTKAVETAQKRVEGHNFEIRKQLIKYDEVMNQQREVIYTYRRNVLKGLDLKFEIEDMIRNTITLVVDNNIGDIKYSEDWPVGKILYWFRHNLNLINMTLDDFITERMDRDILIANLEEYVLNCYEAREKELSIDRLREIERRSLLEVVDDEWQDHLHEMDLLKDGIGLKAYGNKDPLIEYKKESYVLFETLISQIHENVTKKVFTTYIYTREEYEMMLRNEKLKHVQLNHAETSAFKHPAQPQQDQSEEQHKPRIQQRVVGLKVGQNDPCPCGSGKKFKKCCGKIESGLEEN